MLRIRTAQWLTLTPEGPARPYETVTSSRCGVVSSKTTAQAQRTTSKIRSCFYPRERLTVEPANTIWLVRCKAPTGLFSHKLAEMALSLDFWLKPTHALPLPLKWRGLRRAKARFCQTAVGARHRQLRRVSGSKDAQQLHLPLGADGIAPFGHRYFGCWLF